MRTTSLLLAITLAACSNQEVVLSGRVIQGLDAAAVAADAELQVLSPDDGSVLGETRTDAGGSFEVSVPKAVNVFVRLADDSSVTTTFPGVVGAQDEELADGTLYTVTEDEVQELEALFAGCPVGEGKGIVAGEVRHADAVDTDGNPLLNVASQARLDLEGGGELLGCYLDDAGEAYDPQALLNGDSGRFAFFGVPAGKHLLTLGYDAALQERIEQTYPVLVTDERSIAPWFPAWVLLP